MTTSDQQAWSGLTDFKIVLDGGASQQKIYGNGLNQVGVTITLQPVDDDAKPVDVPVDTLLNATQLIDYVSQQPLNKGGSSGWCYSTRENEFHTPVITESNQTAEVHIAGNTTQVTFYVTCDTQSTKQIGASVKTATGKTIYNSQNTTDPYHTPVKVDALPTMRYTLDDITQQLVMHPHPTVEGYDDGYSYAWNVYLSCKKQGYRFKRFDVADLIDYALQAKRQGSSSEVIELQTFELPPPRWHEKYDLRRANFLDGGKEYSIIAPIYDRSDDLNKESFCIAGARGVIEGGAHSEFRYVTRPEGIKAYDQYGNSLQFWPDMERACSEFSRVGALPFPLLDHAPG